ncbi:MAG: 50S ribosomal protein L35 [Chloroflexi bacterium]|nr:50S ribosomal protein L35 [Chloroflexota bacterium]MCY3697721.1 50S ribosomal protein L35 [Chloroflexota bacterium]MXX32930.1 50S ribosomal protein L35 [Chloroflexota bacterium]MXX81762.1 50S ribosomal protein L35 [Chloroflexota bacterium]MYB21912.1 50S ribosomal protein L35 [Chloroflexota bacterium]
MPKMKTHKGAAKRFRITRNGKVMRMKGYRGHNKQRKHKRTLRAQSRMHEVKRLGDQKRVKRLLPYGSP